MYLQMLRSLSLGDTGLAPACRRLDRRGGGAWDRSAGMPDHLTRTVASTCAPQPCLARTLSGP